MVKNGRMEDVGASVFKYCNPPPISASVKLSVGFYESGTRTFVITCKITDVAEKLFRALAASVQSYGEKELFLSDFFEDEAEVPIRDMVAHVLEYWGVFHITGCDAHDASYESVKDFLKKNLPSKKFVHRIASSTLVITPIAGNPACSRSIATPTVRKWNFPFLF